MAELLEHTPGIRRALRALARARRLNKQRVMRGVKPVIGGKKIAISTYIRRYGDPRKRAEADEDLFLDDEEIAADIEDAEDVRIAVDLLADLDEDPDDLRGWVADRARELGVLELVPWATEARRSEKSLFDVLVIQPGISKNGRRYRPEVLEEAAPRLNGARSFASDGPDHDPRKRGVKALVGWWSDAHYERGVRLPSGQVAEGIVARYHVVDPDLARLLRESLEGGKPDLITFSIVAEGQVERVVEGGRVLLDVKRIDSFESVDPVINAAAGGIAVRLVAASPEEVRWEELTADDAARLVRDGVITDADLKVARPDLCEAMTVISTTNTTNTAGGAMVRLVAAANQMEIEKTEDMGKMAEANIDEAVRNAVSEALAPTQTTALVSATIAAKYPRLPGAVRERAMEVAVARAKAERRPLTEAEVEAIISREADYAAAINPAVVKESGPTVTEMVSEAERIENHIYDILAGKSNDSLRAIYVDLTGDRSMTGKLQEGARLSESIPTTSFANLFGNALNRRMLDAYRLPDQSLWRQIATTVPVSDFRNQVRIRIGGYGNLPTVAQGAAYTALTSPGEEKVEYAPAKRGGTEDLTLEAIANDDLGFVRQMAARLGRAAAATLNEFVFDFIATNPTIYDGAALFSAGHNNLGSAALSASTLIAARKAMRSQTEPGSGKRIGIAPRFLLVPIDLEQTAWELTQTDREVGSPNNTLNFVRSFNLSVLVIDYWSDANNWFLVADPQVAPTIEIAFFNGREDPEVLVQDNPTAGSVFTNDKITYKVRHIYGGAVLDYRSFYGAIVA